MITTYKAPPPPPQALSGLAQFVGLLHSHVNHLPRMPMATDDTEKPGIWVVEK